MGEGTVLAHGATQGTGWTAEACTVVPRDRHDRQTRGGGVQQEGRGLPGSNMTGVLTSYELTVWHCLCPDGGEQTRHSSLPAQT